MHASLYRTSTQAPGAARQRTRARCRRTPESERRARGSPEESDHREWKCRGTCREQHTRRGHVAQPNERLIHEQGQCGEQPEHSRERNELRPAPCRAAITRQGHETCGEEPENAGQAQHKTRPKTAKIKETHLLVRRESIRYTVLAVIAEQYMRGRRSIVRGEQVAAGWPQLPVRSQHRRKNEATVLPSNTEKAESLIQVREGLEAIRRRQINEAKGRLSEPMPGQESGQGLLPTRPRRERLARLFSASLTPRRHLRKV